MKRARGHISPVLRRLVWERDRGVCCSCGTKVRRNKRDRYDADNRLGEIDHIVPVVRGGETTEANLRLLCKRCNRTKGVKVLTSNAVC